MNRLGVSGFFIGVMVLLISASAGASEDRSSDPVASGSCLDSKRAEQVVLRAAVDLEGLLPSQALDWGIYELSNSNSYGVVLRYLSVQVTYFISIRPENCEVTRAVRTDGDE